MVKPLVSVIVTSYSIDMLNDVCELLDSIEVQTYDRIETVMVIESSTRLFREVNRYIEEKRIPNISVIFDNNKLGISAARNLGIKEAKGDVIAFVDDDVILCPDWGEEMVKTYAQDSSIVGVAGAAYPLWQDGLASWFPKELYWAISCTDWCGLKDIEDVRNVWGMNMSFKKKVFELAGIFSTEIGGIHGKRLHGEEAELSLRVKEKTGGRIVYNSKAKVGHKMPMSRLRLRSIAKSSFWIGYTRRMLRKRYPRIEGGENMFSTEYRLLRRIFTRLSTDIVKNLFVSPVLAVRKVSVTFTALLFVALGYFYHLFEGFCNAFR